jgi:hypothetical protein
MTEECLGFFFQITSLEFFDSLPEPIFYTFRTIASQEGSRRFNNCTFARPDGKYASKINRRQLSITGNRGYNIVRFWRDNERNETAKC